MNKHMARFLLISLSIAIFCLAYFSINQDVGSDAKLTLLVSQTLLTQRTVRLDAYAGQTVIDAPFDSYLEALKVVESGGHYYAYFPVGPSVLALPVTWPALLLGYDMQTADSFRLQTLLAALTCVVVLWILNGTARLYLGRGASLVISGVFVAGSMLISTLGTALWSLNFTTVLLGLALYLLARADCRDTRPNPYLFGLLLFLAFFARASAVAFIVPAFGYLLWRYRSPGLLVKVGLAAGVPLALFLLWSRAEFGTWLPAYYSPVRLAVERAPLWVGVLGNLVSPSRGLLVFSPFLWLTLAGLLVGGRSLWRNPLVWLVLTWGGLQLLLVARAASWWGGWSFGPRLLTDIMPGLCLLTVLVWQTVLAQQRPWRAYAAIAFGLLGAIAIFIHSGQGLYQRATSRWNSIIDPRPLPPALLGDLFRPDFAQFTMNSSRLCGVIDAKFRADTAVALPLDPLGPQAYIRYDSDQFAPLGRAAREAAVARIAPPAAVDGAAAGAFRVHLPLVLRGANAALFNGWWLPAEDGRLSQCRTADIVFDWRGGSGAPEATLTLTAGAYAGSQRARIALNGTPIGALTLTGETAVQRLTFDAGLLQDGVNTLTFELPDARVYGLRDQRLLGMRFVELVIEG